MGFRINTNIDSLNAYYALSRVNRETATAQLRMASGKKINSVADDTTGFKIGKSLEAKTAVQKSQLNNASAAKNYLATAESSLMQINDLLIQISGKSADSNDPTKDKTAIANDIRASAGEIDSLMKNTGFNGRNILAQADGTALASSDTFGIGGSDFIADFAGNSYLKADALNSALHGSSSSSGGVEQITGGMLINNNVANPGTQWNSTMQLTYEDGTSDSINITIPPDQTNIDLWLNVADAVVMQSSGILVSGETGENDSGEPWSSFQLLAVYPSASLNHSKITSCTTTSGFDIATYLGINMAQAEATGGLMSNDADAVISAARNISTVTDNVRASLGRIGNLTQTVDMRTEYLNNSISNNEANISSLFDADVAEEQMKSTRGSILGQAATSMLTQLNSAPQAVLSLFR